MWFEALTGFPETSARQVRENITVAGNRLKSRVNARAFVCGELEIPSLGELRERARSSGRKSGDLSVSEVVADVQRLHADEANAGALFQVASQFNLLEMVSPGVTPERGVGVYEHDPTQGPACAIACGAGTIYRNYFVPVNGQTGQSAENQIDCLAELGAALGNDGGRLWAMRNGYAWPTQSGLAEVSRRLRASNEEEVDALRRLLRIGIQWDTQVTIDNREHTVSQAYCSALPVAYVPGLNRSLWAEFARFVLEASYEATICAAILNAGRSGNNRLFLTLLGGGAFGNDTEWIMGAIRRALSLYGNTGLEVAIVSYNAPNLYVRQLIDRIRD
jgi:hypothetical protein